MVILMLDETIICETPPLYSGYGRIGRQVWRRAKAETLASRATQSIEASADSMCQHILDLSPRDRLRKAGVLSGNFWLNK